ATATGSGITGEEAAWEQWKLEPETELRFEVSPKETVLLKISAGTAEIFGTGACAGETPMNQYLNTHLALEAIRRDALSFSTTSNQLSGPKVMIVGPQDVGKTSLAKILLSYSVKLGHPQIYADTDIGEAASLSLPGTLAASVFSRAVDVEEGMGGTLVSSGTAPVVFYYGYNEVNEKPKLYRKLMERLAEVVGVKLMNDAKVRAAGLIINTPAAFSEPSGYELLSHAISVFKPTVLLVIGHERLYADLSRQHQSNRELTVLKLTKSGGV
ncbi:Cleavage polyadenylation factor subunit clp1, partial [Physocladia obscura]